MVVPPLPMSYFLKQPQIVLQEGFVHEKLASYEALSTQHLSMSMSMKGGVNISPFEAIGVTRYSPGQGTTHSLRVSPPGEVS